jgi:hypothetical protein
MDSNRTLIGLFVTFFAQAAAEPENEKADDNDGADQSDDLGRVHGRDHALAVRAGAAMGGKLDRTVGNG